MSIVDIHFKSLHTFKGGYIVDTPKILGQWLPSNWRVRIISASFEIYGYLPISPIGRIKRRSLLVTFIVKVIKDVKNIYVLENNQPLKMGI